ncbi:ETS-related transcription factor Elf-3 isoform X2 [Emydura macquarii macquarii]|uniref:ETS-related transcription factor Elf-3 isoform X2 n=1 Tax=Emydura macquarii macquarii TaxID=1129001 RepID=UPI00352B4485
MAGSCEISNIFSNYISAMYQEEAQPPLEILAHLGSEDNLVLPAETTEKPAWFSELPYFWSKAQVLEWISYHVEKNKYDASAINFSCCNMDGLMLCHCTQEQLGLIFGPLGDELYKRLHEIISVSDELRWITELLEKEDMFSQELFLDPNDSELGSLCTSLEEMKSTNLSCQENFSYISSAMSPGSSDISVSGTVTSHSPNSQDSGGSDLDLDLTEAKLFSDNSFADYKKGDVKHGKRKRGRPRKLTKENRDCLETKKSKHSPRGTHLWEFIRDILLHPELNEGLMKWEDRREGVFKFLRSEAVAQLWGQKKKNSSMTYEKLSRAMRYYYKREILERVDGRRLVYKFGKNSSGWKEEDVLN